MASQSRRSEAPATKALSPKQERFVAEYLVDLNAAQAAIRAGYSPKTAKEQGARLLTNVHIQKAVQERRQQHQANTGLTAERVLLEAMRLAFFDIRKLTDAEGNPIPINQLDDDTAAAVAGLDIEDLELAPGGFDGPGYGFGVADVNDGQVLRPINWNLLTAEEALLEWADRDGLPE